MQNKETHIKNVELKIPQWLVVENRREIVLAKAEDRVRYVQKIVRKNIDNETGGPFAAAIFDRKTWKMIACGVNLVVYNGVSIAHAEIVTFTLVQGKLKTYDLSEFDLELVSSCEPCAMCYGAIIWSGIKSVVYSATKEFAQEIGFDEGDKPLAWKESYRKRGIEVTGPVLPELGQELLQYYADKDGEIYNCC